MINQSNQTYFRKIETLVAGRGKVARLGERIATLIAALAAAILLWLLLTSENPYRELAEFERQQIEERYAPIDRIIENATGVESCDAALLELMRSHEMQLPGLQPNLEGLLEDPTLRDDRFELPPEFQEYFDLLVDAGMLVVGCAIRLEAKGVITAEERREYLRSFRQPDQSSEHRTDN